MASRSDVERLEVLLIREQRLLSTYEAGLRRDAIDPALGEMLRDHEREHVRALERTLEDAGNRNPRATVPSIELSRALRERETFARVAMALEGRAVALYPEAIAEIQDPKLRQPLGSIMACGAAHVVALRELLGSTYLTN